jgi:hypothetical protein
MKAKEMSKQKRGYTRFVTLSSDRVRRRAVVFTVAALICCAGVAMVVSAYHTKAPGSGASSAMVKLAETAVLSVDTSQGGSQSKGRLHTKLALQPAADRMRRLLGQRFLKDGREIAVLTGTLTIGNARQAIRITRSQEDEGETVSIALAGGQIFTWSANEGAKANGRLASTTERLLIERVVLDSPDQFLLAQLRAASYDVVVRDVRPAEAGEDYNGSLWDIVRVREPENADNQTQSPWRLFYLNTTTGLIDKVVSQEAGETILAEISGWVEQNGEKVPTHILWSQQKQAIMELEINTISHGSK